MWHIVKHPSLVEGRMGYMEEAYERRYGKVFLYENLSIIGKIASYCIADVVNPPPNK